MPDWANKDNLAILAMLFTVFIGPALGVYLGRFFAKKEALAALAAAFDQYVASHAEDHKGVNQRLAAGEREFTQIKSDLEKLPTREDLDEIKDGLHALAGGMTGVREAIDGIKTTMAGLTSTIQMLNSHELAEARLIKANKGSGS